MLPHLPLPPAALPAAAAVFGRTDESGAPVRSETLFGGAQELQIEHRGALYRLRQTALGKLILTK